MSKPVDIFVAPHYEEGQGWTKEKHFENFQESYHCDFCNELDHDVITIWGGRAGHAMAILRLCPSCAKGLRQELIDAPCLASES